MWLSLGLALWIVLFLIFTEPLDTNQIQGVDKFIYLPFYGVAGALSYLILLPLQYKLFLWKEKQWTPMLEAIFFFGMLLFGFILARCVYIFIVVPGEKYPYTLDFFFIDIFLPASIVIFPILFIGRWAIGRYYEKRLEAKKIEIEGEGAYEGLRLQLNDLISVKADDNYVEVTYVVDGKLKKQLIRNTLKNVEAMVPELLRTHRSYLINPEHFQQFKTENGKLFLQLAYELVIPVTKTYTKEVKARF